MVRQATIKMALEKQKSISRKKTGTYGSMDRTTPAARLAAEAEEGKVPLMAEEGGADVTPKLTLQRTKTVSKLYSDGLSSEFAAELLKKFGRNELPEKTKPKWLIVSFGGGGVQSISVGVGVGVGAQGSPVWVGLDWIRLGTIDPSRPLNPAHIHHNTTHTHTHTSSWSSSTSPCRS
jgi:hypothetical protein